MKRVVLIPAPKYKELLRDSLVLASLEAAGIDNTEAYLRGMQQFYADHPEYVDD